MESRVYEPAFTKPAVTEQSSSEQKPVIVRGNAEGSYMSVNQSHTDKNYRNISKNGDTLELSETGRKLGGQKQTVNASQSAKKVISESGGSIPDSSLASYSETKLRQMYSNKEITKQQYDRVMKRRNSDAQ